MNFDISSAHYVPSIFEQGLILLFQIVAISAWISSIFLVFWGLFYKFTNKNVITSIHKKIIIFTIIIDSILLLSFAIIILVLLAQNDIRQIRKPFLLIVYLSPLIYSIPYLLRFIKSTQTENYLTSFFDDSNKKK